MELGLVLLVFLNAVVVIDCDPTVRAGNLRLHVFVNLPLPHREICSICRLPIGHTRPDAQGTETAIQNCCLISVIAPPSTLQVDDRMIFIPGTFSRTWFRASKHLRGNASRELTFMLWVRAHGGQICLTSSPGSSRFTKLCSVEDALQMAQHWYSLAWCGRRTPSTSRKMRERMMMTSRRNKIFKQWEVMDYFSPLTEFKSYYFLHRPKHHTKSHLV